MGGVTRRQLLATSAGAVAGVTAVGIVASLPKGVGSAPARPAHDAATTVGTSVAGETMVVYVRGGSSGELQLMTGDRQVTINDRALVSRLVSAAS